jgi:hypothetical protein
MLWLAVSRVDRPVGFALMKLRGGTIWLDQLSVLDRWQRHGVGAALIDGSAAKARALGFDALYLSSYRDVPWNGPYYKRRGFEEGPAQRLHGPPAHRVADRTPPRPPHLASRDHAADRLARAPAPMSPCRLLLVAFAAPGERAAHHAPTRSPCGRAAVHSRTLASLQRGH